MPVSRRKLARLTMRWLGEAAVHLFPARCFACEHPLPRLQLLGACTSCWGALAGERIPRCHRCALPLPERAGESLGWCARCVIRPPPFNRTVAAVAYDVTARRFLVRAKDGRRPELLKPLARQLAAAVSITGLACGADSIVPVPSTLLARFRRGYDPAREIARVLSEATALPIAHGVLRKRGIGRPAAKALGAHARWAWAAGSVVARREVPGATILLVDDVLTTGATATACASALRAAGAREVRVAVWARTPSPDARFDRPPGRGL